MRYYFSESCKYFISYTYVVRIVVFEKIGQEGLAFYEESFNFNVKPSIVYYNYLEKVNLEYHFLSDTRYCTCFELF